MARRALLLGGFMGAGKSTVGPLVAARAGVPFVDLDALVEGRAGRSIASIFAEQGETAFRALERAALAELLEAPGPRVVALGGGSLLDPRVRRPLLERACVVHLDVTAATAVARTAASRSTRPLLSGTEPERDPEARMRALLEERAAAYAEAHAHVPTDDREPSAIADDVLAAWDAERIVVPLGLRSYAVSIEPDAFRALAAAASALAPSSSPLVTDANVQALYGDRLSSALASTGRTPSATAVLTPGEEHKQLAAVEATLRRFVDAGADRDAVVLAFGGGVVTDVAGFVAATLLRGVRWIAAPTTLLAMVDASVGGKTGVDVGPAKNAAGAFHQPSAVVIGPDLVATESPRAYRSGLAEVVKAGAIGDPDLLDLLASRADDVLARDPGVVATLVRRAIAVKARIVARDERESGERAVLNFGHTLGHALEAHGGYRRLLHGEAVALGMVAALRIGRTLGITRTDDARRIEDLLARLGLPTNIDEQPLADAVALVALDKKRVGGAVRFVVLRAVGDPELYPLPIEKILPLLARA